MPALRRERFSKKSAGVRPAASVVVAEEREVLSPDSPPPGEVSGPGEHENPSGYQGDCPKREVRVMHRRHHPEPYGSRSCSTARRITCLSSGMRFTTVCQTSIVSTPK